MKTVFDWLSELPETKKLKAVYNCVAQKELSILEMHVINMHEALRVAFMWADTDEGYEYWARTSDKYLNQ